MVLLLMQSINGTATNRPLVALCDSGSSHCMFNKKALPFGATTFKTQKIRTTTTQGTYDCDKAVVLSNLSLPEFVNGRKITNLSAQVFDSENCPYDVILGIEISWTALGWTFNFLLAVSNGLILLLI